MFSTKSRVIGLLAAAAIAAAACGNSTVTPTPTASPVPTPTPVVTPAPTPTPTPTPTPAPTQRIVATIPADQLVAAGTLTVCTDATNAPQESLDAAGSVVGSDIDIATEVAKRLGLKLAVVNLAFLKIGPALAARKCDMSMTAQAITPGALKAADMIPYFHAGQEFVVPIGNPGNIKTVYDLCGKAVGTRKGTAEADHLNGKGVYNAAVGLSARCQASGKKTITVKTYALVSDALLAITANQIVTYFAHSPIAENAVFGQPAQFQVVPGLYLDDATEGIGVLQNRGLVRVAVAQSLQSMMNDGTYLQILKGYGIEAGAIASTIPAG